MASTARDAIDAHVAAMNHGDLDDILDTFTDDAVFSADGGHAEGREELADLFERVVVEDDRPTMKLRRVAEDGDTVACTLTRRFTVTDHLGRVAAAHEVDVHAVFTVRDGAIARVEVGPPH